MFLHAHHISFLLLVTELQYHFRKCPLLHLCRLVDCESTYIVKDKQILFQGIWIPWRDRKRGDSWPIPVRAPQRQPILPGWPSSDSSRLLRCVFNLKSYINWHPPTSQNVTCFLSFSLNAVTSLNISGPLPSRPLPCYSVWWASPTVLPVTASFSSCLTYFKCFFFREVCPIYPLHRHHDSIIRRSLGEHIMALRLNWAPHLFS